MQDTGSSDPEVAIKILTTIARGIPSSDVEERMQLVTTMLHSLRPNDESEALLLGQFLVLQECGTNCLSDSHGCEMFYHKKELLQLGVKLLNCANNTMQALLKYRMGGKQQIQVIHVSGDGKAIIANEMSVGGTEAKNST